MRTLARIATVALFACNNPAPPAPIQKRFEVTPVSTPAPLRNDDCEVGEIHRRLQTEIMDYDGRKGLRVKSPERVELRFAPLYPNVVGHELEKGMYCYVDASGVSYVPVTGPYSVEKSHPRHYFSESYVPNGNEMACDLADILLEVAESQR